MKTCLAKDPGQDFPILLVQDQDRDELAILCKPAVRSGDEPYRASRPDLRGDSLQGQNPLPYRREKRDGSQGMELPTGFVPIGADSRQEMRLPNPQSRQPESFRPVKSLHVTFSGSFGEAKSRQDSDGEL